MEIVEVINQKLLSQFIDLPYTLHKNHKGWLPPIYSDDKIFFSKKKNHSFLGNHVKMFLAFEAKQAIGRVMGVIPEKYNRRHGLNDARFCYIESVENVEVVHELLMAVENWAKAFGCTHLVGPLGFSDKEPQGFELEGLENPPLIMTNVNFPFMIDFMNLEGFEKKTDLVSFKIDVPENYPEELYQKYLSFKHLHQNLEILNFKTRFGVWRYLRPAVNLINELFVEIYAHTPMSKKDIDLLVKRFILLLSPPYMKGVLNEKKELIAFVIGFPDIVDGIQQCNGRLFPLGFWKILKSQQHSKELILMIGGIKKEYRNMGLDYWLSLEYFEAIKKAGIKTVKSHLILEDNLKTHAKMTKFGGEINKRYRIFQREIKT